MHSSSSPCREMRHTYTHTHTQTHKDTASTKICRDISLTSNPFEEYLSNIKKRACHQAVYIRVINRNETVRRMISLGSLEGKEAVKNLQRVRIAGNKCRFSLEKLLVSKTLSSQMHAYLFGDPYPDPYNTLAVTTYPSFRLYFLSPHLHAERGLRLRKQKTVRTKYISDRKGIMTNMFRISVNFWFLGALFFGNNG